MFIAIQVQKQNVKDIHASNQTNIQPLAKKGKVINSIHLVT